MTKDQLRVTLREHVRQPSGRRNPGHSVVAIYLGRDEFYSLLDEDHRGGYNPIHPRDGGGGITFDGVPVFEVAESSHFRIVSEYVDP